MIGYNAIGLPELEKSQNIYPFILNSMPIGILICNLDGRILEINQLGEQLLRLSGLHDNEPIYLFDFISKNDQPIIQESLRKLSTINSASHIINFVTYHNSKFYGEIKLSGLFNNNQQHGIIAIIEDFSEEKINLLGLNNNGEKFHILAENMKDIIWSLSPDLKFTYISPSDKNLRGFEHEDKTGVSVFDIMTPDSSQKLLSIIQNRQNKLKEGEKIGSMTYEAELYCKDGSTFWAEILSTPVFDSNGIISGYYGITRDIQERKEIEIALREIDQRYRTVVQSAPIVLFQIDSKGIFKLSEGGALSKLGLKPGQVVGLSAYDVYKDFPEICEQVKRALNGETINETIKINEIIFDIYYHPLFGKKGKISSLIGIAIEISDRYKAETLLRENEQKFRSLFESMAEGVALHDVVFDEKNNPINYRILEVNKAYEKHTGIKQELAKNILATDIYGTLSPPFLKEFTDVAITGIPYHYETFFQPLDRYFQISVVCTGKNKFATVFEDITTQKMREKELKNKNEELERFTYTVSHDLRSPLVTIKGFIGMLEEDIAENNIENIKDDIRRISTAADKMTDLLNDLLELSRIGRVINPPEDVSMLQIINDTIEMLSGIIKENKAEIIVDQNLPMVHVDKQRIGEVWQNLIENALKFTINKTPKINIGFIKDKGENVFYITDNGQGIEPSYHETVFGLFNKLDSGTSGTGIGLSLVRSIIEVHGGLIWVESEGTNKGSTFKFTIPQKS